MVSVKMPPGSTDKETASALAAAIRAALSEGICPGCEQRLEALDWRDPFPDYFGHYVDYQSICRRCQNHFAVSTTGYAIRRTDASIEAAKRRYFSNF